jgi:ABC-type uncharacterized transport system involved in gliding motility auxiliary subunit
MIIDYQSKNDTVLSIKSRSNRRERQERRLKLKDNRGKGQRRLTSLPLLVTRAANGLA